MFKHASIWLAAVGLLASPLPQTAQAQNYCAGGDAQIRCNGNECYCPSRRSNAVSAPQPAGPSPEEIARQQRLTAAREFNQQGIAAYNRGDFAEAERLFSQAAESAPDDTTIALNLEQARDHAKMQRESAARHDAIVQHLNQLSSDLSDSTTASTVPGLEFSSSRSAEGMGFMDASPETKKVNNDPMVVDGRKVPSGLPKFVDDAISSGYSGAAPGVSDRVRKGFQSVAVHDWIAARAWFQDALNHDPQNAGLKRLAELADFTEARRRKAKGSSASSSVQLPQSADMQFLFPGEAQGSKNSQSALELPKESDLIILFPGLPALDAKELSDYTEKYWIGQIASEPELSHQSEQNRRKSIASSTRK